MSLSLAVSRQERRPTEKDLHLWCYQIGRFRFALLGLFHVSLESAKRQSSLDQWFLVLKPCSTATKHPVLFTPGRRAYTGNRSQPMTNSSALLSIVFMIAFVMLFDRVHNARFNNRFWKTGLLNQQEIDRLRSILSACQQG
jgi:uncharacterized membrane protein YidH (DUF202 family)